MVYSGHRYPAAVKLHSREGVWSVGQTVILHSDLNCFYASVEMMLDPRLKGKAIAVCGSTENRHGIVLAKSYEAKARGVKTAMANWEARRVCPGLICVPPQYDQYLKYSKLVRQIYLRHANDVEPFGMDESWAALNGIGSVRKDGLEIAKEISQAIESELGLSVSMGVSFTKIFAKLGSDMKKPRGITVLDEDNWREKVWPLPVSELLYVGPATSRKLMGKNILTIGDLAHIEPEFLRSWFGKNGVGLWAFANGLDNARVCPTDYVVPIKSVGHGTTCVVDLDNEYAVWLVLYELAQDVGHRLRENGLAARGVQLTVKDKDLGWQQYQIPLKAATQNSLDIASTAFSLFKARYNWIKPVRALTVRGINLISENQPVQLDVFNDYARREKTGRMDMAVDEIRRRFGYNAIRAASLMGNLLMAQDKCETVIMPNVMYQ
jgi:DNA polymerase-4